MYNDETIDFVSKNVKNKSRNKIYEQVFDKRTIESIKRLISKKVIDKIESIIAIGKEANVFKALKDDNFVALKIYRIETSSFDKMSEYIEGDYRFRNVKNNKQNLIFEWTKKEFKNLKVAYENDVYVPFPIEFNKNIIAMQFIGDDLEKSTLKNEINMLNEKDRDIIYKQIIRNLHNLIYKAKLVHADLSEYNMIYFKSKLYFIDMSQSVPTSHFKAKEFYNRDIENVVKMLNKLGIKIDEESLKTQIKEFKDK